MAKKHDHSGPGNRAQAENKIITNEQLMAEDDSNVEHPGIAKPSKEEEAIMIAHRGKQDDAKLNISDHTHVPGKPHKEEPVKEDNQD